MAKTIIAFDLYGTLLSTDSIVRALSKILPEEHSDKAATIATEARRLQLEYSWRVTCMGLYSSFSELTRHSFRQAGREAGVRLSSEDEQAIMDAYNGLDTFPDVDEALKLLRDNPDLEPWIFSNGTTEMLTSSLKTSPTLASASAILPPHKAVSVERLQVFKPHPKVYEHLAKTVGMSQAQAGQVWVVSSNPFDALGAVAAGLKSAWVDRGGVGWGDGLGGALGQRPTVTTRGVDGAVRDIMAMGS